MNISKINMRNTTIDTTDISVRELVKALCDVLDGLHYHDLLALNGLPRDRVKEVLAMRDVLTPLIHE